ncbi:blastopia polyprotein [Lasius niger]|uniref:RNA-directed DNA polymerase n=1 Tax=Lasius niger TaxID=67767 RepID=A0A0J7NF11_LASNI|nr:blastopia polyprotein [Lasius niger]
MEWFHSKPEYIGMMSDRLLDGLRGMFCHRPNKIALRRRFEGRIWRKNETFRDYVHEKVIMANRIAVDDDEVLGYVIDGIPDSNLRDLARVQGFTTMDEMLQAFDGITLRTGGCAATTASSRFDERSDDAKRRNNKHIKGDTSVKGERRNSYDKTERNAVKRCYNCGLKDHVSSLCPTKDKGQKCFKCNEHGHIARNCSTKTDSTTANSCAVDRSERRKQTKDVLINDIQVHAIIDTGSDITIMRADEYIRIGSPRLENVTVPFRGVSTEKNATLGRFQAKLTVDENSFKISINVVSDDLLRNKLLIGRDFLNTVELNMKRGEAVIKPLTDDDCAFAEICQINVDFDREANNVNLSHVQDETYKQAVQRLVDRYKPERTQEVSIKMKLILKDDEPVYQKARRLSVAERNEVNAQIDEWLRNGIVQPSISEYASPVVLVKKKDGTSRLCVDFRLLNKKIVKDRYPLPLIEDQLDALQNARVFSTLDLRNGFFHVRMDESSRKYTAFIVPDGHFEFLRVPFGLCNSPAIFQRFVNLIFKDLIREGIVLAYMDDLIVPSVDCETGLKNLERVLNAASQGGLVINWKKCSLLQIKVEYLGHVIENGCIRPSERKTEAVRSFPTPTSIRQIQSFLGLTGYFRKFIPGYSMIARPLSNLLRAETRFRFDTREKSSFDHLKLILANKPVLNLYRVGAETELHTDASMHGYGAILLQRSNGDGALHPVYYASGKTTPAEEKYTSYELEVLAIVKSLKKFRVYLLGIAFKIVTDCRAFTLTMSKKDLCVRVARWALLLEEFNYEIEHRPGRSMSHVDALSRNPLPACLLIDESDDEITIRLRKAQNDDEEIRKIIQQTDDGKTHDYVIRGGLLFKEIDDDYCLVVPKAMHSQIIRRAHERGHFSVAKTEAIIKRDYYIQNLRSKVEKIIRNCIDCILAEKKQGKQEGFLSVIGKGEVPLDTFHVDHLGPLTSTKKNYKYIFVVVDGFSKFAWLYTTKSTSTAEVVDRLKKQATVFGNPRRIISDRGTAFTSGDFQEYCRHEGIQHILTTTGIPRANGQVERVNRTLIPLLTKLAAPKPEEWYKYLNTVQLYLNTTLHRSIATTPFHLLFGTRARLRDDDNLRELLENEWVTFFQQDRDELRVHARENIVKMQKENCRVYNKKRKEARLYHEGDLVAIKRTQQAPGLKLASKYLGPYKITRALRNNRYLVHKIGEHEGPQQTSTAADFMKLWLDEDSDAELDEGKETEEEEKSVDCQNSEI